jgi:hypothetical protein
MHLTCVCVFFVLVMCVACRSGLVFMHYGTSFTSRRRPCTDLEYVVSEVRMLRVCLSRQQTRIQPRCALFSGTMVSLAHDALARAD